MSKYTISTSSNNTPNPMPSPREIRQRAIEDKLLKDAMKAAKAAKASRRTVPKSSYIRVDEQRMNAYEAGYIIGYRHAARKFLNPVAQEGRE